MSVAANNAFIAFTSLSLLVDLVPLRTHLNARNFAVLLYIFWSFVGCVVYLADATIWRRGSDEAGDTVWCDISTKFAVAIGVALPAASMCISRRAFWIATVKPLEEATKRRRTNAVFDIGFGLGLPLIILCLYSIIARNRYTVVEGLGCIPFLDDSALTIVLVWIWAPVLSALSLVYTVLGLISFLQQRHSFAILSHLNQTSNVPSFYAQLIRLLAFGIINVVVLLPSSILALCTRISYASNSSLAEPSPALHASFELTRWTFTLSGIAAFLLFGSDGWIITSTAQPRKDSRRGSEVSLPRKASITSSIDHDLPRKPSLVHVHVDRTIEISSTFTPTLRHTVSTFEMVKVLDLERGLQEEESPETTKSIIPGLSGSDDL